MRITCQAVFSVSLKNLLPSKSWSCLSMPQMACSNLRITATTACSGFFGQGYSRQLARHGNRTGGDAEWSWIGIASPDQVARIWADYEVVSRHIWTVQRRSLCSAA
jgi:hypothetical protein